MPVTASAGDFREESLTGKPFKIAAIKNREGADPVGAVLAAFIHLRSFANDALKCKLQAELSFCTAASTEHKKSLLMPQLP